MQGLLHKDLQKVAANGPLFEQQYKSFEDQCTNLHDPQAQSFIREAKVRVTEPFVLLSL
jgi:hypothetical protein